LIDWLTDYSQQDAQEFLIYLLEGLHEDLNRVKIKKSAGAITNGNEPDQVETMTYVLQINLLLVTSIVNKLSFSLCHILIYQLQEVWNVFILSHIHSIIIYILK